MITVTANGGSGTWGDQAPLSRTRTPPDAQAEPGASELLFVTPRARQDGFQASVRGHRFNLVDPSSSHPLVPTPNDLFVVSSASELAWSGRRFLRANRLPEYLSVAAAWHTDTAGISKIRLTVTMSDRAEAAADALGALFQEVLDARSRAEPTVNITFEY
jgi:hypothetical protein